jgi:hypothetical protein
MTIRLSVRLHTSEEQNQRLLALQRAFAELCNALAPIARQNGVWSRVGLHHLGYRRMRERFPGLGSQMVCNAVYSVSRACRLVYQHPQSPFHVQRVGAKALPLVQFGHNAPVYFDRHTLSVRKGRASMFTLDGRMHFDLPLAPADEQRLRESRLLEISLQLDAQGYALTFLLAEPGEEPAQETRPNRRPLENPADAVPSQALMPEYLVLQDDRAGVLMPLEAEPDLSTGATAPRRSADNTPPTN